MTHACGERFQDRQYNKGIKVHLRVCWRVEKKDVHKNEHKIKIDCDLKNEVEGMDFQIEEDLKNWDDLMNKDNFKNNETP